MTESLHNILVAIVLAPLIGSILAGLFAGPLGRKGAHTVTIVGVAIACLLSMYVFKRIAIDEIGVFNQTIYTWLKSDGISFEVGFLVDNLTAMMMVVVTFVSLMVHVYTIGYMSHDEENWPEGSGAGVNSYQRFFSYISLFTFSMLMLVMANNFMQLFFGWEAVGLVSYLLIGFWSVRETAVFANLKAFLVNRVGDFGFILGIAGVLMYFNTLDYASVFAVAEQHKDLTMNIWGDEQWSVMTVICILLFIGAMGKSAQVPLHVWLPDSMEGPTPISALIHAATMVTAGIYMVARMSPLYELSETALTFVMIIGALTAFFMGLLGLIQNDIKRVVAYSTLSQLGYMTVALGVSAYAAGVFHLMTHAFFKALLFLGAGSVIIAMHHDQDMRNMGGLRKYMPWTWGTSLVGSLALIGAPGFAGYYSKDSIIMAVGASHLPYADLVYVMVLAGVFITALYSFRMYFLVFHGEPRMDEHTKEHLHECPRVVTWPLIALAVPSVAAGAVFVSSMPFGDFFDGAIKVAHEHDTLAHVGEHFHGWFSMFLHGFVALPTWLAAAGVGTAYYLYMKRPDIPAMIERKLSLVHWVLDNKYGFDAFNQGVIAAASRGLGRFLWKVSDLLLIDGLVVNGSAKSVGLLAAVTRHLQSGYLYHYAFVMIVGLLALFGIFILQ